MRLLLASITCEKGELERNLATHLDVLADARSAGCDLAVFPEMSLTGSVDPLAHPERSIALDHPAVGQLLTATQEVWMPAVFGLAELHEGQHWITQLVAWGGHILSVQRKRLLGDGEAGFATSSLDEVCQLGALRLATVICAEANTDAAWAAAEAGGAQMVLFCSAPGLHGRRTDPAAWRDGFDWWSGFGLGRARRQAAQRGLWVAMATQAGVTHDEDFPGLSALISPTGKVVDRLPDWQPGGLVVDVPVPFEVEPARTSIRVLVVDRDGRTLLAQFGDPAGTSWWVPPGGGGEPGEDDHTAGRRELHEELGRDDLVLGPQIGTRAGTFLLDDRWMTQRERWYLCRCEHFEVDPEVQRAARAEGIHDLRWWSADELRRRAITTGPRDLADRLDAILAGHLPDPSDDLGR